MGQVRKTACCPVRAMWSRPNDIQCCLGHGTLDWSCPMAAFFDGQTFGGNSEIARRRAEHLFGDIPAFPSVDSRSSARKWTSESSGEQYSAADLNPSAAQVHTQQSGRVPIGKSSFPIDFMIQNSHPHRCATPPCDRSLLLSLTLSVPFRLNYRRYPIYFSSDNSDFINIWGVPHQV
jgi:hypothetical protein